MKFKTGKSFRKVVNYLRTVFSFDVPFKFVIDGNFLHKAITLGIDLKEKLTEILGVPVIIDIFFTSFIAFT